MKYVIERISQLFKTCLVYFLCLNLSWPSLTLQKVYAQDEENLKSKLDQIEAQKNFELHRLNKNSDITIREREQMKKSIEIKYAKKALEAKEEMAEQDESIKPKIDESSVKAKSEFELNEAKSRLENELSEKLKQINNNDDLSDGQKSQLKAQANQEYQTKIKALNQAYDTAKTSLPGVDGEKEQLQAGKDVLSIPRIATGADGNPCLPLNGTDKAIPHPAYPDAGPCEEGNSANITEEERFVGGGDLLSGQSRGNNYKNAFKAYSFALLSIPMAPLCSSTLSGPLFTAAGVYYILSSIQAHGQFHQGSRLDYTRGVDKYGALDQQRIQFENAANNTNRAAKHTEQQADAAGIVRALYYSAMGLTILETVASLGGIIPIYQCYYANNQQLKLDSHINQNDYYVKAFDNHLKQLEKAYLSHYQVGGPIDKYALLKTANDDATNYILMKEVNDLNSKFQSPTLADYKNAKISIPEDFLSLPDSTFNHRFEFKEVIKKSVQALNMIPRYFQLFDEAFAQAPPDDTLVLDQSLIGQDPALEAAALKNEIYCINSTCTAKCVGRACLEKYGSENIYICENPKFDIKTSPSCDHTCKGHTCRSGGDETLESIKLSSEDPQNISDDAKKIKLKSDLNKELIAIDSLSVSDKEKEELKKNARDRYAKNIQGISENKELEKAQKDFEKDVVNFDKKLAQKIAAIDEEELSDEQKNEKKLAAQEKYENDRRKREQEAIKEGIDITKSMKSIEQMIADEDGLTKRELYERKKLHLFQIKMRELEELEQSKLTSQQKAIRKKRIEYKYKTDLQVAYEQYSESKTKGELAIKEEYTTLVQAIENDRDHEITLVKNNTLLSDEEKEIKVAEVERKYDKKRQILLSEQKQKIQAHLAEYKTEEEKQKDGGGGEAELRKKFVEASNNIIQAASKEIAEIRARVDLDTHTKEKMIRQVRREMNIALLQERFAYKQSITAYRLNGYNHPTVSDNSVGGNMLETKILGPVGIRRKTTRSDANKIFFTSWAIWGRLALWPSSRIGLLAGLVNPVFEKVQKGYRERARLLREQARRYTELAQKIDKMNEQSRATVYRTGGEDTLLARDAESKYGLLRGFDSNSYHSRGPCASGPLANPDPSCSCLQGNSCTTLTAPPNKTFAELKVPLNTGYAETLKSAALLTTAISSGNTQAASTHATEIQRQQQAFSKARAKLNQSSLEDINKIRKKQGRPPIDFGQEIQANQTQYNQSINSALSDSGKSGNDDAPIVEAPLATIQNKSSSEEGKEEAEYEIKSDDGNAGLVQNKAKNKFRKLDGSGQGNNVSTTEVSSVGRSPASAFGPMGDPNDPNNPNNRGNPNSQNFKDAGIIDLPEASLFRIISKRYVTTAIPVLVRKKIRVQDLEDIPHQ